MPENTALAAARLLSMVTWISRQPHHTSTVGDLARHFGRSVRQIERDLDHLTYFRDSLPGDSFELQWVAPAAGTRAKEREANTVSVRQSHGMSLPAVLRPELAVRAIVGLQALAPTLDPHLRDHVPRTVIALDAFAPGVGRSAHDIHEVTHSGDVALLPQIRTAIEAGLPVSFTYTDAQGVVSQRDVIPQELTHATSGWTLVGYDRERHARRHFLVERLSTFTCGDTPITTAPLEDSPREGGDTDRVIRVLISARAQWLIGDFATLEDPPNPDESLCPHEPSCPHESSWPRWVRIRVWNDQWIRSLLIMAADGIHTIDDPQMEADVRAHAQAASAIWSQCGVTSETSDAPKFVPDRKKPSS